MKSSSRAAVLYWSRLRPASCCSFSSLLTTHHHHQPLLSRSLPSSSSSADGCERRQFSTSTTSKNDRSFSTVLQEATLEHEEECIMPAPPPFRPPTRKPFLTREQHQQQKRQQRQNEQRQDDNFRVHTAMNTNKKSQPEVNGAAMYPRPCTCSLAQEEVQKQQEAPMPPPLPAPIYSVHKRVLPENLTALSSPPGRKLLLESFIAQTSESYWCLMEHFVNQSDPAFCGVTTLLMVLNAANMDPNIRWKGGWRYYGDESVLLHGCCLNAERIRRVGITMEQFMTLGTCHGMHISMKRPAIVINEETGALPPYSESHYNLEEFRKDIQQTLDSRYNSAGSILVTSFSRASLGQTGDGHFSPIAAYHEESDQVLVLDVARFKYAPYWATVKDLYDSMVPFDQTTQMPRGWYIMKPPPTAISSWELSSEDRRPAHLVPQASEANSCPVGQIKVQYCPATKPHKAQEKDDDDKYPKELMQ